MSRVVEESGSDRERHALPRLAMERCARSPAAEAIDGAIAAKMLARIGLALASMGSVAGMSLPLWVSTRLPKS